ncbi:immunoglobulin-binding protein 1 [Marchantia polymorpha subsp. ruderalis]|uniref:TAP42-like protein n=2 Tax=Marchantia polymorpha TaxID=3197 RepID=A0A176VZ46_MARPO|nr:hypothetical protein AXG93_1298s1130 [Marchantia polymorpha subsp. ruderalis]PTQ41092.1 hypothetical protein MARPO_0036s0077 [Marchantia polymorpha]BBM97789.1 hypothetical protein Mp_1g08340 [Marchantia polymorpha subsp. ruderalis]|eukprot:PTQ41092.1 hypothetical protein MARPO_0036s0077 [Marchantia polymorpha]
MGEEFLEDAPLPALYERALQLHNLSTTSTLEPEQVRRACALLELCQEKIDRLGLFSTNEEKEDISTADLKYFLVPYYLGDFTEKLASSDRLQIVRASQSNLKAFIRNCDNLNLVPGGELEALTRDTPANAETRRSEKVARFKRQKAAESKLQEIKERRERRRRSTQAAAKTSNVEHGEEDLPDEDDEEEREAQFAQISYLLCKAFDLVDMLKKEEDMLVAIQEVQGKLGNEALTKSILDERQAKAESWHKEAASKARTIRNPALAAAAYGQDVIEGRAPVIRDIYHQPQLQQHRPLLFGPASVIDGSMSTERERMVAEVFQPTHRLPTMSIEQAGLAEMEMMTKWNEQNAKMQAEANTSWHTEIRKRPDGEDDSDDEGAEYKARAWDDWKDENPRGAGNSSSKPVR